MANFHKNITSNLEVAPWGDIKHDFKKNFKSIIFTFIVLVIYILLSSFIISLFEQGWSFLQSMYFTIINTTTVGFGDIYPMSSGGKIIACVNAVVGLVFFGAIVALVSLAFQPSSTSENINHSISKAKGGNKSKTTKIAEGIACLTELLSDRENCDKITTDRMCIRIRLNNELDCKFYDIDIIINNHA